MSTKTIKVLIIEPGNEPYAAEIPSGLESLQKQIGGLIQVLYPFPCDEPAAILCNEEGKLLGLPWNRPLYDEDGNMYDIIPIEEGTILQIRSDGNKHTESFCFREHYRPGWWEFGYFMDPGPAREIDQDYLEALRITASYQGIESEQIDYLLEAGFSLEEIEEAIYEV